MSNNTEEMANPPIIQVKSIGDGFPVLIVPGWEMNGHVEAIDFEPIFAKVPGYRRLYVDLPGMGDTPASGVQDLDGIYQHLVDYVNRGLNEPKFLLTGSSCGGYLAHALAQEFPDRVGGLLLRVPVIIPHSPDRDVDPFQPIVKNDEFMADISPETREVVGDEVLIQTPEYVEALRARLSEGVFPAIAQSDSTVLDLIRNDPKRYRLSHLHATEPKRFDPPALILTGRQDDQVGYRDSLKYIEMYPRATYVALDRGVHGLPVDELGLFESLVRDWLFRVREWQTTR